MQNIIPDALTSFGFLVLVTAWVLWQAIKIDSLTTRLRALEDVVSAALHGPNDRQADKSR